MILEKMKCNSILVGATLITTIFSQIFIRNSKILDLMMMMILEILFQTLDLILVKEEITKNKKKNKKIKEVILMKVTAVLINNLEDLIMVKEIDSSINSKI